MKIQKKKKRDENTKDDISQNQTSQSLVHVKPQIIAISEDDTTEI